MALAAVTATRATCVRRAVGCVLLSARGHVLSTGYNGRAAGLPHCHDRNAHGVLVHPCEAHAARSGERLDLCEAIHAEQNALLQCADVHAIDTCFVTTSPCLTCVKLLLNTGCRRIVFREAYPHAASTLWEAAGRRWELLPGLTPF